MQRSEGDYFDFIVPPLPIRHAGSKGHHCLTSSRKSVTPGPQDQPARNDARIEVLERTIRQKFGPPLTHLEVRRRMTAYLSRKGSKHPRAANRAAWRNAFEAETKGGREHQRARSHVMFRVSVGDYIHATSIEVTVPREHTVAAVDAAIAHMNAMHAQGYHHLSPLGVRFVGASPHYLAPQYDMESCTIEAPILIGAHRKRADESTSKEAIEHMLRAFYERFETLPYRTRFHWGQRNFVDVPAVGRTYPKFTTWLEQMRRLNPFGTFDNEFTDRLGLSVGG